MKTRTDLLNFLVQRYDLRTYLEIGVQNPDNNFNKILAPYKVGVDPCPMSPMTGTYKQMTSDDAFHEMGNKAMFDLVLIDGLHIADQARRDFFNADKILSPRGFIVLHDCNPDREEHTHVPRDSKVWYGDVYKFASQFSGNPNFVTVDIDCGCGVFRKTQNHRVTGEQITWEYFNQNRKRLLNLVSADEFLSLHQTKTP